MQRLKEKAKKSTKKEADEIMAQAKDMIAKAEAMMKDTQQQSQSPADAANGQTVDDAEAAKQKESEERKAAARARYMRYYRNIRRPTPSLQVQMTERKHIIKKCKRYAA